MGSCKTLTCDAWIGRLEYLTRQQIVMGSLESKLWSLAVSLMEICDDFVGCVLGSLPRLVVMA